MSCGHCRPRGSVVVVGQLDTQDLAQTNGRWTETDIGDVERAIRPHRHAGRDQQQAAAAVNQHLLLADSLAEHRALMAALLARKGTGPSN